MTYLGEERFCLGGQGLGIQINYKVNFIQDIFQGFSLHVNNTFH